MTRTATPMPGLRTARASGDAPSAGRPASGDRRRRSASGRVNAPAYSALPTIEPSTTPAPATGQRDQVGDRGDAAGGDHRRVGRRAHLAQQLEVRPAQRAVLGDVGDDVAGAAVARPAGPAPPTGRRRPRSSRGRRACRAPARPARPRSARRARRSPTRTTPGPPARRCRCSPGCSRWPAPLQRLVVADPAGQLDLRRPAGRPPRPAARRWSRGRTRRPGRPGGSTRRRRAARPARRPAARRRWSRCRPRPAPGGRPGRRRRPRRGAVRSSRPVSLLRVRNGAGRTAAGQGCGRPECSARSGYRWCSAPGSAVELVRCSSTCCPART